MDLISFYEASFHASKERDFLRLVTDFFCAKESFLFSIPDAQSVVFKEAGSGIEQFRYRQAHPSWVSLLEKSQDFTVHKQIPKGFFDPLQEEKIQSALVWLFSTTAVKKKFFLLVGYTDLPQNLDSYSELGHRIFPCIRRWMESTQLLTSYEKIIDRFHTVMDTVEQPMIYVDAKSEESWINPSASGLLGLPTGEQQPVTLSLAMQNFFQKSEKNLFPVALDSDSIQKPKVYHFETKEPNPRYFEIHTRHTKTGVGKVWFFQDITSAILLSKAIQEKSEIKLLMASRMSHEIRNPLTGIIGIAEMLLDSPLEQGARNSLELIHRSGLSLLRLINEFLDLAKMEFQQLEIHPEPIEPEKLIQDAILLLDPIRKSRNNAILLQLVSTYKCNKMTG